MEPCSLCGQKHDERSLKTRVINGKTLWLCNWCYGNYSDEELEEILCGES